MNVLNRMREEQHMYLRLKNVFFDSYKNKNERNEINKQ